MHRNEYDTKGPMYNINTYMERIIILVDLNVYKCQCLECGEVTHLDMLEIREVRV
jgi:hypothetical protein